MSVTTINEKGLEDLRGKSGTQEDLEGENGKGE